MNREPTKELPNKRSFEERVFARFDAFDVRFDSVDARFNTVDARFNTVDARFDTVDARLEKLEARSYDTKPIWERALAKIMELGLEMGDVKSKVGVIEGKVQLLETEIVIIKTDHKGIRNELVEIRREVKHGLKEKLDLITKFLLEDREDIRDAEERIRELESKFA